MIVLLVRKALKVLIRFTTHCTNKNNLEYVKSIAFLGIAVDRRNRALKNRNYFGDFKNKYVVISMVQQSET